MVFLCLFFFFFFFLLCVLFLFSLIPMNWIELNSQLILEFSVFFTLLCFAFIYRISNSVCARARELFHGNLYRTIWRRFVCAVHTSSCSFCLHLCLCACSHKNITISTISFAAFHANSFRLKQTKLCVIFMLLLLSILVLWVGFTSRGMFCSPKTHTNTQIYTELHCIGAVVDAVWQVIGTAFLSIKNCINAHKCYEKKKIKWTEVMNFTRYNERPNKRKNKTTITTAEQQPTLRKLYTFADI